MSEARQAITGEAEGLEDLIGIVRLLGELFASCGNRGLGGVPPRPQTDSDFLRRVRFPEDDDEKAYQITIARIVTDKIRRTKHLKGRALRRAQWIEYGIQYHAGKDAIKLASDEQLLAMRDDAIERQAA